MQRSLLLFLESVRSETTQKQYLYYLNKFMKESGFGEDYDLLSRSEVAEIQVKVEDYVISLKKTVNPNSVPSYIYPIQSFLDSNDIELKWKKIKRLFPANIKKGSRGAYTTEHVRQLLDVVKGDLRSELVIHILASTGCRIGALFDLKIGDLTILPEGYTAIRFYTEDVEEYHSFLTPEANNILQRYLNQRTSDGEQLTSSSPVLRARYRIKSEKVKPMTNRALEQIVIRALRKSGLRSPQEKKNNRYEIPVNHGFRKRFITILKSNNDIPVAYAERLAGHMVYTDELNNKIQLDDSYLRPDLKLLLKFFKLAVPDLTIDQTEKDKQVIEMQQEQINEVEKLRAEIEKLKEEKEQQYLKKKKEVEILQGGFGTKEKLLDYLKEELKKEFSKDDIKDK